MVLLCSPYFALNSVHLSMLVTQEWKVIESSNYVEIFPIIQVTVCSFERERVMVNVTMVNVTRPHKAHAQNLT